MKFSVLFTVFLVLFQLSCAAEEQSSGVVTINLKTKGQIKGVITEEFEEGIVVDTGYGTVVLSRSEIESIKRPAGREKESMVRTWKKKKAVTIRAGTPGQRKRDIEALDRRIEEDLRIKKERDERARREGEHRISFTDSSKITVSAVLNDEIETKLVVDTGATLVVIPLEVAEQLPGVETEGKAEIDTKLADGTVRKGVPIMLESVEVAGLKAKNIEAVTMDLQGRTGLLGMSFLNRFHLRIDSENNELVLKEKEVKKIKGKRWKYPYRY
ncbi:MAG: retroviral-like aspartic protease family protein [Candidatus Omnitrophota bacterium]